MATYGNTSTTAGGLQYAGFGGAYICCPTDDLPSNAQVDSIYAYVYYISGTSYFKFAIWDESKNLISNSLSSEITISNSSAEWKSFSYTTKPSLSSGQRYYIGMIDDNSGNNIRIVYQTSTGEGGYDISKTYDYTDGEDLGTLSNTDRRHSIYINYTVVASSGPSQKIEGVTPGKFEYTSWADLKSIK